MMSITIIFYCSYFSGFFKLENILGSMRSGADSKEKVTQYIYSILTYIKITLIKYLYIKLVWYFFSWFVSKLLYSGFSKLLSEQLTHIFLLLSSQKSCSCSFLVTSLFIGLSSSVIFFFQMEIYRGWNFCSPSRPAVGIF